MMQLKVRRKSPKALSLRLDVLVKHSLKVLKSSKLLYSTCFMNSIKSKISIRIIITYTYRWALPLRTVLQPAPLCSQP